MKNLRKKKYHQNQENNNNNNNRNKMIYQLFIIYKYFTVINITNNYGNTKNKFYK